MFSNCCLCCSSETTNFHNTHVFNNLAHKTTLKLQANMQFGNIQGKRTGVNTGVTYKKYAQGNISERLPRESYGVEPQVNRTG